MSEMKPVAWAIPDHMPNDIYPHCELVLYRSQAAHNTLALYTADQLAEAVAAERERCVKVCEDAEYTAASVYLGTAYDPENRGADCAEQTARDCAEAIRSAAK